MSVEDEERACVRKCEEVGERENERRGKEGKTVARKIVWRRKNYRANEESVMQENEAEVFFKPPNENVDRSFLSFLFLLRQLLLLLVISSYFFKATIICLLFLSPRCCNLFKEKVFFR